MNYLIFLTQYHVDEYIHFVYPCCIPEDYLRILLEDVRLWLTRYAERRYVFLSSILILWTFPW